MESASPVAIISAIGSVFAAIVAAVALALTVANAVRRRGVSDGGLQGDVEELMEWKKETSTTLQNHLLECREARGELKQQIKSFDETLKRLSHTVGEGQRTIANWMREQQDFSRKNGPLP